MSRKGKKFAAAFGLVDRTKLYDLEEAIALSQKAAFAKFDESVDAAVKLGVDPRHSDQMVRGAVVLPNGTGKEVKVLGLNIINDLIKIDNNGAVIFVNLDEIEFNQKPN